MNPDAEQSEPLKADLNLRTNNRTDQPRIIEPTLGSRKAGNLATPAVRGLLKEHDIDILQIQGSGRDGRVLKEDVRGFLASRDAAPKPIGSDDPQDESTISMTPIQSSMFKTMSRSLSIPHFLYTDEINLTPLSHLRRRLNASTHADTSTKLTYLPFIVKALSSALHSFTILNARLEASDQPKIIYRSKHNIGVAVDTPTGLVVPVVHDVARLNIPEIAARIAHLSALAREGRLSPGDLAGGSITVSNIGNIGGMTVSPIIVPDQVVILGIGRARDVPAFNAEGHVEKRTVGTFCWSCDHRIVDGATVARAGEMVRRLLEEPGQFLMKLR